MDNLVTSNIRQRPIRTLVSVAGIALGVSLVKIDGRIVRRLHEDQESFSTAKAIHAACKEIGVRTIAELVELRETAQKLAEIGIDYAQGYGVAKPAQLK